MMYDCYTSFSEDGSSHGLGFCVETVGSFFIDIVLGRRTKDPIVLVKILLIQYLEGFRSVHFTCKQVKQNATYRWFLGISPQEKIPDHSTISKFLS